MYESNNLWTVEVEQISKEPKCTKAGGSIYKKGFESKNSKTFIKF
jgi:hypothetical protein